METVQIARREFPVRTLGPGRRIVLWVQGCPFRCLDCIVPEWQITTGGNALPIAQLAEEILALRELDGITLSGGDPMLQAEPLAKLIQTIREYRDVGLICYTGYTYERLAQTGNVWQKQLMAQVDLLIDGLYDRNQHADLLWRGSSNQRLIPLTERYRYLVEELTPETDRSAGLLDFGHFGSGDHLHVRT